MNTLNSICHRCMGVFRPLYEVPGWSGCSCSVRVMTKPKITIEDYFTSSGKYPDRANSPELTTEVRDNAIKLLAKVNQALTDLGVEKVEVSSGFRDSSTNASLSNSAKRSGHMRGLSIDFSDKDGKLDELSSTDKGQDILEKHGIWQEHPSKTPNWKHWDIIERPIKTRVNCKKRQFNP